MTPVVNYFAIQNKIETGDYSDGEYPGLDKILYKENVQARKNLKEIHEILKEIPDNN